MEPVVYTVDEVAELLGQSPNTIYRALDAGLLPELPRFSKRRVVPRVAVDRVIDQAMAGWEPDAFVAHLQAAS